MPEVVPLLGWLGGIALYMAVMAATPGPNNVLLAASGVRFGFRRTMPFVVGIGVGMLSQLVLVAAGLGGVLQQIPLAAVALKVAGTAYIGWLALQLWRGISISDASTVARPMSVAHGVGLQYLNPKSWLAILTLVSTSLATRDPMWWELALGAVTFIMVVAAACCLWAGFGSALRRLLKSPTALRVVSRSLAVCALASAAILWA